MKESNLNLEPVSVSDFRLFVLHKYNEYTNECDAYGDSQVSREQYLKNNRWFLKNLFKESQWKISNSGY